MMGQAPMAASNHLLSGFDAFGDEVFTSTELNRRAGEVLNHAREHPVTISRNNELFALLRREEVAKLVQAASKASAAVAVVSEAYALCAGGAVSIPYSWLTAFEPDDLRRLSTEVLTAIRQAFSGNADWSELDAVIHEWKQSALAAQSGVLDEALREVACETPLQDPDNLNKTEPGRGECPTRMS